MSSTFWPGAAKGFCTEYLDDAWASRPSSFRVVDPPGTYDWDDPAFKIFLLGHNAVSDHAITFSLARDAACFDITWKGKIALAYMGQSDFAYGFEAKIYNVKPPLLFRS